MDRAALRQFCWDMLGVKPTDPFYTVSRVDTALNVSEHQIAEEIRRQAPSMLRAVKTLAADSPTGNTYSVATQAPPITDLREILELRLTDSNGSLLGEVDDDMLNSVMGLAYSLVGTDKALVITTSSGIAAGTALYLKYNRASAAWTNASDSPETVPDDFHDVVGFRALPMLFALGGEARMPAELSTILLDRSGALWNHVGKRSRDPQLVRGESVQGFVETVRR